MAPEYAMQILVRKMAPGDLPRVTAILAHWNMAPAPASAEQPEPELACLPANTLVALADRVIVGVASYLLHSPQQGETSNLAVDPAWRGTGVGDRLQRARLEEMRARGVERVRTESDRPEVIAWYVRKYGYRIVGRRPKKHRYGLDGVDDWTVLELDLRGWCDSLSGG
jgi:ribosomal protein S18 acetylase RimI-like enzyme